MDSDWDRPGVNAFPEGIVQLRADDQAFIETVGGWIREEGDEREAALFFPFWHHAEVVARELAQCLDLTHSRRDRLQSANGKVIDVYAWAARISRGRRYDVIFVHPQLGLDDRFYHSVRPCTGRLVYV